MPRHTAFLCLRSGSTTPLREVDRYAARRGLDSRDTALARKLVGTELRRRGTLRAVTNAFTHTKPKADLATILRLGVLQLFYLDRVPEHAAVSETVRTASEQLGTSKGSIVNGVLRNVLRAAKREASGDPTRDLVGAEVSFAMPLFRDPAEHPHLWAEDALSIPSALHKKWASRYGLEEANRLGELAGLDPSLSMRVGRGASRDDVRAELASLGVDATDGAHGRVLLAPADATGAVVGSEAFRAGRVTIQGGHALRAAELAGPTEGLDVLDLCAAPGGKAAVLAEGEPRTLVTADVSPRRLDRVHEGVERMTGRAPRLVAMDGASGLRPDADFDLVFVDAPCSNTGVLAARPAARWRYGPKSQSELVALQTRLLEEAASHVRPGGALVWSTCSLEPEENARLVRGFLESRSGFAIEEEAESLPRPASDGGPIDGGWAARLRRVD